MIATVMLALALAASPPEPADPPAYRATSRVIYLVGEQLSFDRVDCVRYRWAADGGINPAGHSGQAAEPCDVDDLQFRARYRVLESPFAETGSEVEFLSSGWNDYYAHTRAALIYMYDSADGMIHPPGIAVSVYPTADGDWASCDAEDNAEPIEFAGNPVFAWTSGMSPYGIAETYPSADFAIIEGKVYCIRGRRLQTLIHDLDRKLSGRLSYLREAEAGNSP